MGLTEDWLVNRIVDLLVGTCDSIEHYLVFFECTAEECEEIIPLIKARIKIEPLTNEWVLTSVEN